MAASTGAGSQHKSLPERSVKGYEIYSWQIEGEWRYALVMGSNRLKSYDEVTAPFVAVKSLTELKSRLAELATGDEIIWGTAIDGRLALPPQPVIADLERTCQQLGLYLLVLPI